MNRETYYKHLQNLNSWKNYALSGIVANVPEANKIDQQIFDFQDKWANKLAN